MQIRPEIQALLSTVAGHRRALHRIPEEGLCEFKTQQYVLEALAQWEPDVLAPCADTGVRAVFRGDGTGKAVAFRADMDALSVTEKCTHDYVSGHPGYMHACGHDGHMANLLGLAQLLAANRGRHRGDVVLLFQPAEESVGGAKRMVEAGALKDPDVRAVYGLHMMPDLPIGRIGTRVGPLMAQTCELDIDIIGKTAHGAMPHLGVDAIAAAAHLYTLLQTAIARNLDPYEHALLTVGRLMAGERRNILAAHAKLECTARTFSDDTYVAMRRNILNDLAAVEIAMGVHCQMTELTFYPCVNNPEEETERLIRAAGDAYVPVKPKMIAEDFSYYQKAVPAVFCFLGCADGLRDHPLHSALFDFDEVALLYGMELFARLVDFL